MFVDASAIIAILTNEPEADALADALEARGPHITSAVALFEAAVALCRKRRIGVAVAQADVREFLAMAGIDIVPITERDAAGALDAFARYGKGLGHPAQLNMGDCFAYAVARNWQTGLLFKGDDFSQTDLVSVG